MHVGPSAPALEESVLSSPKRRKALPKIMSTSPARRLLSELDEPPTFAYEPLQVSAVMPDEPPLVPEKDGSAKRYRKRRTTLSEVEMYLKSAIENAWHLENKDAEDAEEAVKMERLRSLPGMSRSNRIEGLLGEREQRVSAMGLFGPLPVVSDDGSRTTR